MDRYQIILSQTVIQHPLIEIIRMGWDVTCEECDGSIFGAYEWPPTKKKALAAARLHRRECHPRNQHQISVLKAHGGEARRNALSPEKRREIARRAANIRWGNPTEESDHA